MQERDYLKRFNQGYYLKQNEPELAAKLQQAISNKQSPSAHDQAFIDGMNESEKERFRDAFKERGKGQKRHGNSR